MYSFLKPIAIILLITLSFADGLKRTVNCTVHADSKGVENINVIHVTATSPDDVIHYLWSTFHLPSVIVARTTKDTNVTIDVDKLILFQKGAISFDSEPLSSTGFTISQLWQYSYAQDNKAVSDFSSVTSLNLETFNWENVTDKSVYCSEEFAQINVRSSSSDEEIFNSGGSFEVEFSAAGIEISAPEFPHLIYTGNTTQIKAAFNHLYSNSSRVRYGMQVSVFGDAIWANCLDNETCPFREAQSVSDEFSPGVFTDSSLFPPCSKESFVSWRPVAYVSRYPSVANSTDAEITSSCHKSEINSVRSIAELYFDDDAVFSMGAFNMTFGTQGDGFYPKTKYTAWSIMIGVGRSIGFKVSLSAVLFVSIGLGALGLFIVGGLVFVTAQKCLRKTREDEKRLFSVNS